MHYAFFFFHGISKAEAASPVVGLMVDLMGVTFLCFGENFVQGKGNEHFNRWGSLTNYYTLQNCWRGTAFALVCFVNLLPCLWGDLAASSTKTWSERSQAATSYFCGISERAPQSTCQCCSAPDIRPHTEWHFWVTSWTFSMYHLMSQNLTHARVSIWLDGHDARGNSANRHPRSLVKMTASIAYNHVRSSRTSLTGDRKIKQTLHQQRKPALDSERCDATQWAALQFRAFYSQVINLI